MRFRLDRLLFAPGDGDDDGALAVHVAGEDHDRASLRARVDVLARALADAGVEAGVPVGVMLPNGVDVVATMFAVWRAGGVYAPLNPRLGRDDLGHALEMVEPGVVVTDAGNLDRFGDRALVLLDGGTPTVRTGPGTDSRHDEAVALVQFTSGTTGRPRPVLLEHEGVIDLIDGVLAKLRGDPTRAGAPRSRPPMPNLVPVSLSVWAGIYTVLFAFRAGAPVVVMDGFDTREFVHLVKRFELRSTVLPPAAMTMLCDDDEVTDLEPLRFVRSISSPLSPLQARRFRDQFGIAVLNSYGQTEIGGEIVGWNAADSRAFGDTKLGSVGRPHEGVELRTDPVTGEIQVRTPAMSAGYADGADLADRLTDDGWFRTGDVGTVDGDGFLWIEGRLSDMINRGGLKVFPGEVEEVLRLHGDVADAAVAGVADERLGEVPVAFVVTSGDGTVGAAELDALCREHLAPYKAPAAFHPVGELPRNDAGKVRKAELVRRAETGSVD